MIWLRILFYEWNEVYVHGLPGALRRKGQTVDVWDGSDGAQALRTYLETMRPDVVLTMGWTPSHADGERLELLRAYGRSPEVVGVYWATEDPPHTAVWTLGLLERLQPDAVLTLAPRRLRLLRELGYMADEMPFAADRDLHRPTPGGEAADVVLVGNGYGETGGRFRPVTLDWLLRPLVGTPWRVRIHGRGWEEAAGFLGLTLPRGWLRPPVPFADIPRIYSAASVVLAPQNDAECLTSRVFDALGTGGGALLAPRTPALRRFFDEGVHLFATSSPGETREILTSLLPKPATRLRVARAGRSEVLSRHTYDHRADFLLARIATCRAAKRRGAPLARAPRRIVRPERVEGGASMGEPLTLSFNLPTAPPGTVLKEATLELFTEGVDRPGDAACTSRADGSLLDVRHISTPPSMPYPYAAGWTRFRLKEALESGPAEGALVVRIHPTRGLAVTWLTPRVTPARDVIRIHAWRFWPRLSLAFERDPGVSSP